MSTNDPSAPRPVTPEEGMATRAAMAIEEEIRTTRSPTKTVELPGGYLYREGGQERLAREVVVSEASGASEDILGGDMAPHLKFGALLGSCVTRVGPFTDRGQIEGVILPELSIGDRAFLLLEVRRVTLGDKHYVIEECDNERCTDAAGKRTKTLYTVDLGDVKVIPMPNPMARTYEVKVEHSRGQSTAVCHVMAGQDESRIARYDTDRATLQILARLDQWDGRDVRLRPDGKNARELIAWAKGLSWDAREQLRDAYREAEGGIDTTLQLQCPLCGREFERELAVSGDFFRPSAILRHWKKTSNS